MMYKTIVIDYAPKAKKMAAAIEQTANEKAQAGWELMSQDELAVMDGGKCILQLRGVRPFLSDKYDITKHPNFKYTADADDKNAFDIEAFLSARLKLKPNEVCDVYEVDTKGA